MNEHNEIIIADILSEFTDLLNQGTAPSLDEYVARYSSLAVELRPVLESLVQFRRTAKLAMLSKADSDAMFARIQALLSVPGQTWPALAAKDDEHRTTKENVPQLERHSSGPVDIQIDKRPDFLILLLYFMGEIWGNTKLVKLLFLLGKEGHCDRFVSDFYSHYAFSYGAFDKAVPQDAQALVQHGIINRKKPPVDKHKEELDGNDDKRVEAVYELTEKGKRFAKFLLKAAQDKDPDILKSVKDVVLKYGKKTTDELLDYTYNAYPETAEKSKVKDKYLKKKNSGNSSVGSGGDPDE